MQTGKKNTDVINNWSIASHAPYVIMGVCGFLCAFIVVIKNDYHRSGLLPLAPFIYLFLTAFTLYIRKSSRNPITVNILQIGYFIRMVLSPLFIVLTHYDLEIKTSEWISQIDNAVLLASLEYIALSMYIVSSKRITRLIYTDSQELYNQRIKRLTRLIIILICGFVLYCVITNPGFLLSINNAIGLIRSSEDDLIAKNVMYNQMRANSSSSLFTLYSIAMAFVQVILPAALLNGVNNRIKLFSTKRGSGSVLIGFVIIIVSLSFLTDDLSKSIIIALAIFVTLAYTYPDIVRKWIPVFGIIGTTFAIVLLLAKSGLFTGKVNSINSLGRVVNTYFSGIPNISVGMTVKYDDKLLTALGDFTRSIPVFAHYFLDLPRSQDLFNFYYHGMSGYTNEVMPTICYGYKYLGPLAPVLSLIIYSKCIKLETQFKETNSIFNKAIYAYLFIYFAICPFMYMFTSFLTMFWYSLIFAIIIHFNTEYNN